MKRYVISTAFLVGGIAIGLSLPESIRAQAPGYATKQVFKTDLVNLPGPRGHHLRIGMAARLPAPTA